jgi:hypothetical protein
MWYLLASLVGLAFLVMSSPVRAGVECCECHNPGSSVQCPAAAPVCFTNISACLARCPEFGCEGSIVIENGCADVPSCQVIDPPVVSAPAFSRPGIEITALLLFISGWWLLRGKRRHRA